MPIYSFHCEECDKHFDSLMKPYDPVQCPDCKSTACTKQVTTPSRWLIRGDNSSSTPKRQSAMNPELDRRAGKRERVDAIYKRNGIKNGMGH